MWILWLISALAAVKYGPQVVRSLQGVVPTGTTGGPSGPRSQPAPLPPQAPPMTGNPGTTRILQGIQQRAMSMATVYRVRGQGIVPGGATAASLAAQMGVPPTVLQAWNRGSQFRAGDSINVIATAGYVGA